MMIIDGKPLRVYESVALRICPRAYVNDLTQAFLFSTAMIQSVPQASTRIFGIFEDIEDVSSVSDSGNWQNFDKEINQYKIIHETSTLTSRY